MNRNGLKLGDKVHIYDGSWQDINGHDREEVFTIIEIDYRLKLNTIYRDRGYPDPQEDEMYYDCKIKNHRMAVYSYLRMLRKAKFQSIFNIGDVVLVGDTLVQVTENLEHESFKDSDAILVSRRNLI